MLVARPVNNCGDSRAATQGRPYETWIFSQLLTDLLAEGS